MSGLFAKATASVVNLQGFEKKLFRRGGRVVEGARLESV